MASITTTCIDSYDVTDHPLLAPLYDEDDRLDVCITATGKSVRSDYGVPGSPVWYEIEDIDIEEFEINGVAYTPKAVEQKWDKDVADELYAVCADIAAEKDEWE